MISSPSPNFNARALDVKLEFVVLHYTGMQSASAAMARMCDAKSEVSAHYCIFEDGEMHQLVDEQNRAWHAGKSYWRSATDLNSASIGVELVNPGHEFGYRPFPETQLSALEKLLSSIVDRHKLKSTTCLLAHSDIAVGRRADPGELFPWQRLAERRFGLWPRSDDVRAGDENEVCRLLQAIGYDVRTPSEALLAFQRRFHPENLTGLPYPETMARLRSVKALMER